MCGLRQGPAIMSQTRGKKKPTLDLVNEHFALVGGRKEQFTANNGTCWFPGSPKSSPHSPQGQGPATVIALP